MPGSKHPAVYINTLLEEKPVGCHLGMFYRRISISSSTSVCFKQSHKGVKGNK